MEVGMMGPLVMTRQQSLVEWLRTANMYNERGAGGASNLLVPLTHHALRANGVPLPVRVMLTPASGGLIVEAAWRGACDTAERGDQRTELCQVAVAAVAHYIQTHGRQVLSSRLEGEEEWPSPSLSRPPAPVARVPRVEAKYPRLARSCCVKVCVSVSPCALVVYNGGIGGSAQPDTSWDCGWVHHSPFRAHSVPW